MKYAFFNLKTLCLPVWKWKWKVRVAQLCPTLCDPMDYRVHGVLQARILEWVAFPFSRGSSQPRDRTQVSHIAGGLFTSWVTKEACLFNGLYFRNCFPSWSGQTYQLRFMLEWRSFMYFFFLSLWQHYIPYGLLVPQRGIKITSPALEVQSLNHWTAREVPRLWVL